MLKSSLKDFVTEHLQLMFSTVKHTSQDEREVCTCEVGTISLRDVCMCIFMQQMYSTYSM